MASPSNGNGKQPAPSRPTTFYFAYGSNLHLKQMKRRCPNSKYIGMARLVNYRWHINERGYANVVAAPGHWVDGLVYEINSVDEAKLDINEGVSKNAYAKKYINVHLQRAPSPLYRRPTSWIVNRGGPSKISRQVKQDGQKTAEHPQHWVQKVLVYISLNYVQDSPPKDEYVNRINFGLADAKALGMEESYISNCIRPFIPESGPGAENKPATATTTKTAAAAATQGQKRNASPRTGEPSPARRAQGPTPPDKQRTSQKARTNRPAAKKGVKARVVSRSSPPPLPPRPVARFRDVPVIVVEEWHFSSRSG